MPKLFIYLFIFIILASNTDLVRAMTYYFSDALTFQESLNFMQANGLVERFYMLVGNAFNYAAVLFFWIIYRKKTDHAKQWALWLALLISAAYFFSANWDLWLPIAQGAQMSDNFALGFLKITATTNIIGALSGALGLAIGKHLAQRQK